MGNGHHRLRGPDQEEPVRAARPLRPAGEPQQRAARGGAARGDLSPRSAFGRIRRTGAPAAAGGETVKRGFAIDVLPRSVARYRATHAVVAIDVFRATTTIVTALQNDRRVFTVPTLDKAAELARLMPHAVLAGEQAGDKPPHFHLQNSPSAFERLSDR